MGRCRDAAGAAAAHAPARIVFKHFLRFISPHNSKPKLGNDYTETIKGLRDDALVLVACTDSYVIADCIGWPSMDPPFVRADILLSSLFAAQRR